MIYIELKDGVVRAGPWDYTGTLPNFSDVGIITVDVTNESPMPAERWTYDGTSFTAPVIPAITVDELRVVRNGLLRESDWRDLQSYPGTDQVAWQTYRQALRDLPTGYVPVIDPVYPAEPSS